MKANGPDYDVFFSYSLADADVARDVQQSLEAAGLIVADGNTVRVGDNMQGELMRVLAESGAFLAVVSSRSARNPSIAVEMGAAWAWNKPLFVVGADAEAMSAARYPQNARVFTLNAIDEVVVEIQRSLKPLSSQDRDALATVYARSRVPTDRLIRDPAAVDELASRFNRGRRHAVSGERLVRELIRMRKRGQLRRLGRAERPESTTAEP